jgi:hypothetical protein
LKLETLNLKLTYAPRHFGQLCQRFAASDRNQYVAGEDLAIPRGIKNDFTVLTANTYDYYIQL